MAKVLKAPVEWTGTFVTSEGEVELEKGVAVDYTQKVAEHLIGNVPGWRYGIIEDGPVPESAGAEEDSESGRPEAVDLPVLQDTVKTIQRFARDHGIEIPTQAKAKKDMLSVIYAHFDQA